MPWSIRIILIAGLAMVVYVEGLTNPFTLWNASPLIVAGALIEWWSSRTHRKLRAVLYGFALLTGLVVLLVHLAWVFDLADIATGSSTAGLIFVVLPLIAVGFGAVGAMGGAAWGWLTRGAS